MNKYVYYSCRCPRCGKEYTEKCLAYVKLQVSGNRHKLECADCTAVRLGLSKHEPVSQELRRNEC